MPGWLGPWELVLILAIALVIFGTSRLTGMGKTAGTAIREFRNSLRGEDKEETDQEAARESLKGEDTESTGEEDES